MNNLYDDEWIIANWNGKCDKDLLAAYIEHTGSKINMDAFRKHISNSLNLSNTFRMPKEVAKIISKNYEKIGLVKTTELINNMFDKNYSIQVIQKKAKKMGLNVPKELANSNANPNIDPIGTIREEPSSGYLVIKIKSNKWIKYNRYLYEKAYGSIPKGYSVIFLDGDNRNFDLSNLIAIPRDFVVYMNSNKIRSHDPEVTRTAIKWCELYELFKSKGGYLK